MWWWWTTTITTLVLTLIRGSRGEDSECLAYCGVADQGFANTLDAWNWVYTYAEAHGKTLLKTAVMPQGYESNQNFINVFGAPEWDCDGKLWRKGEILPGVRAVKPRTDATRPIRVRTARCKEDVDVRDVELEIVEETTAYTTNPCASILQITDCFAFGEYANTADFWRDRYHNADEFHHDGITWSKRAALRVVIDYRIGEVDTGGKKDQRTKPSDVDAAIDVLIQGAAGWWMDFVIATDSPAHADVKRIYHRLLDSSLKVLVPVVTNARNDFDKLVNADITICGGSQFCRLAATLSRNVALATNMTPLKTFGDISRFENVLLYYSYEADVDKESKAAFNEKTALDLHDLLQDKFGNSQFLVYAPPTTTT